MNMQEAQHSKLNCFPLMPLQTIQAESSILNRSNWVNENDNGREELYNKKENIIKEEEGVAEGESGDADVGREEDFQWNSILCNKDRISKQQNARYY